MYIYYNKKLLKNKEQYVEEMRETPIENYNRELLVELINPGIPNLAIYVEETDSARVANIGDLVDLGFLVLSEDEFYDSETDSIVNIHSIPCDPSIIKRKFDFVNKVWYDAADDNDKILNAMNSLKSVISERIILTEACKVHIIYQKDLQQVELEIEKRKKELEDLLYPNN